MHQHIDTSTSEIMRLRAHIEAELTAAHAALHSLASGTAKHDYITARMERIGGYQQTLATLIGEAPAMEIVCDIFTGDGDPSHIPHGGIPISSDRAEDGGLPLSSVLS